MRDLTIPAVRGYLRYAPTPLGKRALWSVVMRHFLGLEPPEWDFTVSTVFGSKVTANTRDTICKYIYYFGVWEPNLTHWIRHRLSPGDVFIDVGANIGYFTLLASRLVGDSGKVIAVEALPAIFASLENNLKINGARNVRVVNCAAWDAEEMITIYTQPENLPGQTTVMPAWASKWHLENESQIPAAPLSAILKPEEFRSARLIKIDVEGAEWHALCGMRRLMSTCRDDLEVMIEVDAKMLEAEGRTSQDVLNFFGRYGFHSYRIENDYSANSYLGKNHARRPSRVRGAPITSDQTDFIFSRIDADSL
jgi:FkbM family methyltransferase